MLPIKMGNKPLIRLTRALGLLFLLSAQWVCADEVRPAYLQITERAEANNTTVFDVLWKQPAVQNGRLAIDPIFPADCVMQDSAPPQVTGSAYIQHWATDCDLSAAVIHISGLSVTLTDVMVRIDRANGNSDNYLLRPENPNLDLSSQEAETLSYLWVGIEHLVFSIDHVLFVIGLVLFIKAPLALLKTVTAFTVAHSITLALSIFELVALPQGPVEAMIALSILFLARELAEEESKRSKLTLGRPWVMAFLFGLLHGLGFAGALNEMGLPQDGLWLSLLLFNLGIEVGQLIVIATLLALIWFARRFAQLATLTRIGAWGMGCMAAFWTIDRTLILL